MCDINTALCCACNQLLSFAHDRCLPLVREAAIEIWDLPTKVTGMKTELEIIESCIYDPVRMAKAEEDNTRDGMKTMVNQLREVSFHIEDVIDEYMIREKQEARDSGCAAAVDHLVKTMIRRLQIAYKIQNIKSRIRELKDTSGSDHGFQIQSSSEHGPSSSIPHQDAILDNLQQAHLYVDAADVVGFEAPSAELVDWLVKGRAQCTVISVVGMGGQGKTTLAKKVFDSKEVIDHFDCHAWITVSQSYTVEGLLMDMLQEFYKHIAQDYLQMDRPSLTNEVRKYLKDKRYVLLFDDVWNTHFWDEFEFALIDKKKGSRIFITTRNLDVAMNCNRSFVQVHDLRPLNREKSLELFNKKAFLNLNGCCPRNLMNASSKIVEKCEGSPLAIVTIGSHLSAQSNRALEWEKFSENLISVLGNNPRLSVVTKILGFSFHDIPYHLKRCLLYFGIYPEGYEVKTVRLVQQWIAEGFVKDEMGRTAEEVAEGYLTELIRRSLVQVSLFACDGTTRSCRVHNLIRKMILDKIHDLSFCHFARENEDQSVLGWMIRRLTIATNSNNLMENVEFSSIRSLHVFRNENLPDSFVLSIPSKHRLLKVLDFEDVPLYHFVPQNLGDLFHLRYLSFRNTKVRNLPASIGMLHNLETLDIRQTLVREMPREINKLRKLRNLLAYDKSEGVGYGIQMQEGIGEIASLQTLREVEADHGGVELIKELEKLTQLRKLGLTNVKRKYTGALCSLMNKQRQLEKLYIASIDEHEFINLNFRVSLPKLWKLRLIGKLARFPEWVQELQNLVKLSLSHSMLTHDPLTSLKDLPNLLYLGILYRAYEGKHLQFPAEGFGNLKQLELRHLYNLNCITIGGAALSSLEKFKLVNIPRLKEVPAGVHNLPKLHVFQIMKMPDEFTQSIVRVSGQRRWIIEQVPFGKIIDPFWAWRKSPTCNKGSHSATEFRLSVWPFTTMTL